MQWGTEQERRKERRKEISLESLRRETVDDLSITFSQGDLLLIHELQSGGGTRPSCVPGAEYRAVFEEQVKTVRVLVAQLCLILPPWNLAR